MANSIKGITIELNGDTTGLTDALKDVNKATRSTASELKQVERALQMNPGNTELIAQRQELLAQQISNTTARLDTLRTAQAQVQAQFERGEISGEQYRAFQRELIRTEGQLESLQRRAQQDVNVNVDADASEVNRLERALEGVGDAAKKTGSVATIALKGVAGVAAGAATAVSGLVVGMTETNRDLAMLETQLGQVALSVDDVRESTVMFASVGQETDQISEAMGNLVQAGYQTEEAINGISQNIAGAITKYGDTFSAEGLAESITTTTQLGEVTGQLTDLLEKEGVNVDNFNAKIQSMSTEQERANYITQLLADQGLAKLYEAYATGNPQIIAQAEANQKLQQNLSDLSVALTPLVTGLTEFANIILDAANGNITLGEAVDQIGQKASSVFPQMIDYAQEMFGGFLDGLEEVVPKLIAFVQENLPKMVDEVGNALPEFVEKGVEIISSIVEGLSEALPNLVEYAPTMISNFVSSLVEQFPSILETGVNVVTNLVEGIANNLPKLLAIALELVAKIAATIITNLPAIIAAGAQILSALIKGILSLIGNLVSTIVTQVIPNMVKAFVGKDWSSIGADVVRGIAKGITKMAKTAVEAIAGVANGVIKKAKSLLKINSPSKVFTEFGEWVGIGLADGMESTESLNEKIMTNLTNKIIDVKEDSKKELVKIDKDLSKESQKINQNMEDKILKIQNTANKKKRKLTSDEAKQIERLRKDAADKILKLEEKASKDRAKVSKEEAKRVEENYKELYDSAKTFVDNKKSLNQMSIVDEATFWRETMNLFEEGTEQRIKAQEEYRKASESIQKSILDTNQKYTDEFNKILENQTKQEEQLNKAYQDAVDNRSKTLFSFAGLFDEFKADMEVTGQELLTNLADQVLGFREWQRELDYIANRGIDDGLLQELRELGPKSLPELKALNSLTSEQLDQYSELYRTKTNLARTQAEAELKGMKEDTEKQIRELRSATNKELTQLEREWHQSIKSITQGTQTQLMTLTQIGTDAARGLLNGLSSMDKELNAKAKSMADNISKTIKDALKVKSPSRVMIDVGHDVGAGLAIGMDDMVRKIAQTSQRLSNAASGALGSLASSSAKSQTNQVVQQKITNNSNVNLNGLIQAISELAQRPINTSVNMDGRVIATAVSGHQYNTATLNALTKGVSL